MIIEAGDCRLEGEKQGVKPILKQLVRYLNEVDAYYGSGWSADLNKSCRAGSALIFRNISSNFAHI
ncbi:MAG TPA: hypothetical protein VFD56_01380 [Chitinophagaceae bacterium]|nr:hypothetical protein [Chitinophagaceae bacterium]